MSLILGIDPGLNTTGYGLLDVSSGQPRLREAGVLRGRGDSVARRVHEIHRDLCEVIGEHRPTALALEQLYTHYDRPKTAILMGHARGVICLAAAQAEVPVFHYAATQIKKVLTGNGRAPKEQMQLAIQREFDLESLPEPADLADAIAVALCHHHLAPMQAMIREE